MVNTLPFPERATEELQNSSCVATLVEHGVFILFFFFLLEGVQQVMQKNGVCVGACG